MDHYSYDEIDMIVEYQTSEGPKFEDLKEVINHLSEDMKILAKNSVNTFFICLPKNSSSLHDRDLILEGKSFHFDETTQNEIKAIENSGPYKQVEHILNEFLHNQSDMDCISPCVFSFHFSEK